MARPVGRPGRSGRGATSGWSCPRWTSSRSRAAAAPSRLGEYAGVFNDTDDTITVRYDADAFVALPGGLGTLEELLEIYTWAQLGLHRKPCALLDVESYYARLAEFLEHVVAECALSALRQGDLQAALSALEGGVQRVRISDIAAIADARRGTVLTRVGSMAA